MTTDSSIIVEKETTTSKKIKEPSKYKVIIYNDNFTTVEFVISLLMIVFKHNSDSAVALTEKVHNEGSAVAGVYRHEIAEQKCLDGTDLARAQGFPLLIKMVAE